jgi:Rad3-related DNA helicase
LRGYWNFDEPIEQSKSNTQAPKEDGLSKMSAMYRSREQTAYATLIAGAIATGAPLLAGAAAGLGKTHGYTIPLVTSGRRVAIGMSTRQLIAQYMESDALRAARELSPGATVAVLQSRREFDNNKAYREHKEAALAAQVLVVTHAAALIDSLNPGYADLRSREVVLFDEADLLADAADLRCAFSIAAQGDTDRDAVLRRASLSDDPEERAAARAISYALAHPAFYKVVGFDDDGDLVLKHRMPGRMLKPLVADCRRVIFTSGTLQVNGRFDHFVRAIGLTGIDPASRHIDPRKHGMLTTRIAAEELPDEEKARRILAAERPCLVLTTSHADTERLGALLPGATIRGKGEALVDAVVRCPADGIFVAAGAWSGLDSPTLRWKTVAIPKAPYGAPVELDGQQIAHYIDSKVTAIRRINQGLHRGLRTEDATCTLLLLDPRCNRRDLLAAIPPRFNGQIFAEGQRNDVVLSKAERDPALRNAALKHHGAKCMDCGDEVLHRLDVHHLDPIAEGQRRTTLADVVVVCKNCHADRHAAMRRTA